MPGEGLTESSKGNTPGPQLPYERDQSAAHQGTDEVPEVGRQAHEDLAQGQADTGRLPVTDEAYQHQRENDGAAPRGERKTTHETTHETTRDTTRRRP